MADALPPEDLARLLVSPALAELLAARAGQLGRHGHSLERDLTRPLVHLPGLAQERLIDALQRLRAPLAGQNLAVARRQLAVVAALCMAGIERIDAGIDSSEMGEAA